MAASSVHAFNLTTTVSAGTGTITPASSSVSSGGSQTFTVTPGSSQQVVSFLDNGIPAKLVPGGGNTFTYTLTNITADHTVSVTFASTSFTSTSSTMTYARSKHTATQLQNGLVLIAGGEGGSGRLSTAELYNPATKTFAPTGSMAAPRGEYAATLLADGRVLITGGIGSSYAAVATAEIFDPANGTFSTIGAMSQARCRHTATLLANGKVLIAGGETAGGTALTSAAAELFDPATGMFTSVGSLLTKRAKHTATLLNSGKVLIAGGGNSLASTELFNPWTGQFTSASALNTGRYSHTATLLGDGRVLLAGGFGFDAGWGGSRAISSAEIYDPGTGIFSTAGALGSARQMHAAALLTDGTVLLTGGIGISGTVASIERFNPITGTMNSAGNMTTARHNHAATLLANGDALVAGGYGSNYLNSAEHLTMESVFPIATISGTPANPTNIASATLTIGGTGIVAYRYRLDSNGYSAETPIFTPINLASLTEADHAVSVLGKDSSGTWQVVPTSVSWIVDVTPPATTPSPGPGIYGTAQSVSLNCSDSNGCSAIWHCLGSGCTPTNLYSSAISITTSADLRFYAVDRAGNSETTTTATYDIVVPSPPGAPTGVTATAGNGQATVSFTSPASNGGSVITSYTVTSAPGSIIGTGSNSPIIVTGLAAGTAYTFTVTATNAAGTGPASAPSGSATPYATYSLALTVNGSGTVHSTPAPDINCSGSCGQSYDSGTVVVLTATPGSNYSFDGWSGAGGCIGTGSCIVTMSQARSVTAYFLFNGFSNGSCGSAHNSQSVDTPAASLCLVGTPSAVSGIGPWSWTCAGSGGGTTASCSAVQAGGVFYRSSDGGVSWTGRATGIGFNSPIYSLAASPAYGSDHTVFLGSGVGTYKSTTSGDTWTLVHGGYSVQALSVSPAFATDRTVFAGFYLNSVYKSTDGGINWTAANSGIYGNNLLSLTISPNYAADQVIYAGLLGKGVYKSINGGASWLASNTGIDTITPLSLAISPNFAADQTIYAATTDGQYGGGGPYYHVYKSVNGGSSWSLADTGLAGSIKKIAISPSFASDNTLFAITSSGTYKSSNRGDSWGQVNMAVAGNNLAVSPSYGSDQTLFTGIYGDNIYRSSNGGASWTPSSSDFVTIRQLSALAISPAFASDNTVFAAAYFAGPQLSVLPGPLNFGNMATGTTSISRQVTIANGMFGDATLAIGSITVTGTGASQFTVFPGNCGSLTPVLVKGAQCTLDVTFAPTVSGSASATLQITSNDISMPSASVSLSGTGVSVASTITSPSAGAYTNATSVAVSGMATCSGGCTVSLVEVSADGGSTWQTASGTTSWSITLPTAAAGSYSIRSRATSGSIVETPGTGITVTVDRQAPIGTLALYNGVWNLNANARDGDMCLMVYPNICGTVEMSPNGVSGWQSATTAPGTSGPLWLRDRAGNVSNMISGVYWNDNGGPIRLEGGSSTYYSYLQHALNVAGSDALLKVNTALYSENLTVNTFSTGFTVRGGYNSGHSSVTGTTQLGGSLTVQNGTLTVENLDVTGTVSLNGGTVTANALSIQ